MATQSNPKEIQKALTGVPGTEPGARLDAWWWLVALVVGLTVLLVTVWSDPFGRILKFVADFQVFIPKRPFFNWTNFSSWINGFFGSGVFVTVFITLGSFVIVLFAGIIGGLGRLSKNKAIYGVSSLYVEIVRGIPLLVQLIWWYYAFPAMFQAFGRWINWSFAIHYQANAYLMAILGLVFCYGAYMSEIYRAGIQSIPKGQMEAARSQGMTYFQAMRYVILPQAIRVILPPVGNEFTALLKDSSLVSVVAVADMTRRGREFMSFYLNPISTWTMIALLYLIMTLFSARLISFIEKKTKFER
jgi:polar amino acid transport system permease protein